MMKRQPLRPCFSASWSSASWSRSWRQRVLRAIGLVGTLGGLGIGTGAIGSVDLLLPQAVRAYVAQDLLTVSWVAGEDYTALAKRAEDAARTMAQQRFDSDILLTRVIITVLGQYGGQTAPILVMDVNRPDWRNRPDPRYWSQYYRSTPALLGLDGVAPTGTLQPPGAVQPAPAQPAPAQPVPTQPNPLPSPEAQPAEPPGAGAEPAPEAAPATQPSIFPPPRPSSTRRSPGRSVQNQQAPGASFSPAPSPAPNLAPASPQPTAPSSAPNPVPASPQPTTESGQPQIDLPAVPADAGIPGSLR